MNVFLCYYLRSKTVEGVIAMMIGSRVTRLRSRSMLLTQATPLQPVGTRDQCALSFVRGHAVRARLTALGIPEASIAVEAFGNRDPVPGPDLLKRRVQIDTVEAEDIEERSPYPRMRKPHRRACPQSGLW